MKPAHCIVLFLLLLQISLFSQKLLHVSCTRLGSIKTYEVLNYEVLEYKLKGEFKFRKNKIVNMRDSSILFENYTEIKLSQLKALRLRKNNHLVGTLQTFFLWAGIGFISLNTINNMIVETSPLITEKAVYISAGLIATSFLIREIGIKRVRVTKNKDLKILDIDFQHMNVADSTKTTK